MFSELQKITLEEKFKVVHRTAFLHFIPLKNKGLANEGFKLHISATPSNWWEILDIFTSYILKKNTQFKIISNKNEFLNSFKERKNNLIGKFITIYVASEIILKEIVFELGGLLRGFNGPKASSDRRVPNSKILSYRYGIFTEGHNLANNEIDQRMFFKLPSYIPDPFPSDNNETNILIGDCNNYKITKVLSTKPYSSVFLTENGHGNHFVIKEGKKFFPYFNSMLTGDSIRGREFSLAEKSFSSVTFFPKTIEKIQGQESNFYVYEFVEKSGEWPINNSLVTMTSQMRKKEVKYREGILTSLIKTIQKGWNAGFVFNDIAPRNFILTSNREWKFIDLEHSHFDKEKKYDFQIRTKITGDSASTSESDKTKLLLLIISTLFGENFLNEKYTVVKYLLLFEELSELNDISIEFTQFVLSLFSEYLPQVNLLSNKIPLHIEAIQRHLSTLTKDDIARLLILNSECSIDNEFVKYNGFNLVNCNGQQKPALDGGTLSKILIAYNSNDYNTIRKLQGILELSCSYKMDIKTGILGFVLISMLLNKSNFIPNKIKCMALMEVLNE